MLERIVIIKPPADLADRMVQLAQVLRYQVEYYPDIFRDQDVFTHEKGMVVMWRKLEFPEGVDIKEGERMIWIHDIPEILTGEVLVVEKSLDRKLDRKMQDKEDEVAPQLLGKEDIKLLARYNKASQFWKGEGEDTGDVTALAVRLVDIIDGNVVFHRKVSEYCRENGILGLSEKMEPSFRYAFKQGEVLRNQLNKLSPEFRVWFGKLIDGQFEQIINYWRDVEQENLPGILREEFINYEKNQVKSGNGGN